MNLARNLEQAAFYFGDRPAVIEGDRVVTFGEFDREANRVATALAELGVKPGDPVALCAPNSYQWLAFYFGALKAGAVVVTLSNALQRHELLRVLNDAQPKVLFTVDERLDDLTDRQDLPYLRYIVSPQGDIPYGGLLERGSPTFKAAERERSDTAAILYTGGTTGIPKGVMLSHENILTSSHNVSHYERSTHEDRAICYLPLNHVFAQVHIMNATVLSGGSLILLPSFDLERVLEAIERHRVTKFYGVPTIYIRLLSLEDLEERFRSVRYCFSAASSMHAELVQQWKARTGLKIHEAYGMTESASMVTYNHYWRHVVGSVGTPVGTIEVQIRDLEGNVLPPGAEGEICIRGPNIMRGYLKAPEETRSVFWDDWFRSGDIGLMDEDGYLYIVDRLKDLIITGGENVYPREVEEALYSRPEVEECAVIGLPDKEWGERVVACIVPRKGQEIDPQALKAYLKARLSPFKVPKEFITMTSLPKSSTGKTLKRELKRRLTEGLPSRQPECEGVDRGARS